MRRRCITHQNTFINRARVETKCYVLVLFLILLTGIRVYKNNVLKQTLLYTDFKKHCSLFIVNPYLYVVSDVIHLFIMYTTYTIFNGIFKEFVCPYALYRQLLAHCGSSITGHTRFGRSYERNREVFLPNGACTANPA